MITKIVLPLDGQRIKTDGKMEKLTVKEEQIMQVLWALEKAFVNDIKAELPEPKPHYNTICLLYTSDAADE